MRLHYIDWLRIFLAALVVAHHGGQAYGPTGGAWPVFENERTELLGPFFSVNAGFFMGLFFLISGYFVPGSLRRKGLGQFIIDRLVRLGIPLFVVGFGIFALIGYGDAADGEGFWTYFFETYIGQWRIEYGPLWFVFHLLVYSLVYALLVTALPALSTPRTDLVFGHGSLLGLSVFIAITGGLVRLIYPQDTWINVLGLMPVEPAHFPQYLALFVVGTMIGRGGGFSAIPDDIGSVWLTIGLLAAVAMYVRNYLASYAGVNVLGPETVQLLFPLWEALLCVGLCAGLITFARKHWSSATPWLPSLAGATYGVYVFHVFIIVPLNLALLHLATDPFVKFLAVTALTLVVSFPLVVILRKLPLVARVL